jgi:CRISPR/Cas system Type II protein with McrA/HNH and RuvC-like nuclease domain
MPYMDNRQVVSNIANDPEKLSFFKTKAQAYKYVSVPSLIKLYLKQEGRCALCGDDILFDTGKTHIDHIIPKAKGGEDYIENFELVCGTCNYAKRDMSLKEFVLMCLKVENEYHKTDILPKEDIQAIVERRWEKEREKQNSIVAGRRLKMPCRG